MRSSTVLKLFSILFFAYGNVYSQTDSSLSESNLRKLMEKANSEREQANYPQALEYYTKAEALATKKDSKDTLATIKNNIGIVYKELSNFGEALGYYQSALDISKELKDKERIAKVLTNIGALYSEENDQEAALYYYKQAYPMTDSENTGYIKNVLAINLSDVYNKLDKPL